MTPHTGHVPTDKVGNYVTERLGNYVIVHKASMGTATSMARINKDAVLGVAGIEAVWLTAGALTGSAWLLWINSLVICLVTLSCAAWGLRHWRLGLTAAAVLFGTAFNALSFALSTVTR